MIVTDEMSVDTVVQTRRRNEGTMCARPKMSDAHYHALKWRRRSRSGVVGLDSARKIEAELEAAREIEEAKTQLT